MRARVLVLAGVVTMAAVGSVRAAGVPPLNAKEVRGTAPTMKPGVERGVFVWTDDQGLHLRWVSDGKPVLFAGSVQLDRPVTKFDRVNKLAGGWVQPGDNQNLLFSATATTAVDGFDLTLSPGTSLTLDLQVNGEAIDVNTLYVGAALVHPAKMPIRFAFR